MAACGGSSPTSTPAQHGTSTPAQHGTGTGTPATESAAVLTARMKAAGLPITDVIVYNATTDPNHLLGRQGGYTSKTAWVTPAAVAAGAGSPSSDPGGTEFGGGIEVFATTADAQSRLAELKAFKRRSATATTTWQAPRSCACRTISRRPRQPSSVQPSRPPCTAD